MTAPELTLRNVQEKAKKSDRVVRVSDFLSSEQKRNIQTAREQEEVSRVRKFDKVDAYTAEILARFGWDAWQAWQNGQIGQEKMLRMVLAERAREKQGLLGLEALILAVGAGANNPSKSGHMPKSLHNAIKILKNEQKQAKGVING